MNPEAESFLSLRTLPARLNPEPTAWYFGCKVEFITVLIAAGLFKPLGKPSHNACEFSPLAELEQARADTKWFAADRGRRRSRAALSPEPEPFVA